MENFIFKVDRTLNPNKLYDEELFFDEIEQEYLPPNRVYRGGRWVTAKDGSRSYQNNGAPNRTVSMGLYLQLHKMYFMLLKAALIPESFGDDDESRAVGRAFITEMKQNREFASHCGALFRPWNEKKIIGKRDKNGPEVKNAVCRSVLQAVIQEGVSPDSLEDNYLAKWSIDFALDSLRNRRGPTGEATSKRICLLLLNHEKVRAVGEEQLKIAMKNKIYDKKCQFFNAVIRCRANLYHKALSRYFKEVETVDQAITSGEADEVTTNRNVRSSHYPQRPAEAEDIIVGVTKINKYFGSSGWFEGRITKYNEKEKLYDVVYDDGDEESLSLEEVLPQVVLNFLDYYALPVDDSRVGNDSDSEQNSDEEENSVTSSDNLNSEEEEEKTEKCVRRGYLKWRVPMGQRQVHKYKRH